MKKIKWNSCIFGKFIPYAVLAIIAICFLLPFLWVVFASFDANASVIIDLPNFTLNNFSEVLSDKGNQRAFYNGLIISLGQAILVVIMAVLAAYPLSRYQLRYKKPFMYTILFMTGLPITAVMVPVYQLFIAFNLIDSLMATTLFLAASSLPYAIWMTKNFMGSVPIELEESAWVDGASVLYTIRKVILPLMRPGIFTVFIYTFSRSWGNFFVPYILLSSPEKLPASVVIYQFFGMNGEVLYGQLAAFSLVYTVPSILLYILGQKFMSEGFSLGGATKG